MWRNRRMGERTMRITVLGTITIIAVVMIALLIMSTNSRWIAKSLFLTLEDMNLEIHLPKEGQIISKDSRSQAKLIHGIHVVLARNYVENLKEEVKKGMREKAEQGIYPSRPPLGYRNNKLEHTIEVDPVKAPIAQRMFELYGSGQFSLELV
jgi:site-specific DNA recombinase